MQEETNLYVFPRIPDLSSQHGRQEHEVVVVHPNHVSVLNVRSHCFGKEQIGLIECIVCLFVKGDLSRVVVEERPEDGICQKLSLSYLNCKILGGHT